MYYWINFINALCYNVNKTIEFRFLRPTYNFQKIILWLYIFNAILCFADKYMVSNQPADLRTIIRIVYPNEIANRVIIGLIKLGVARDNQERNGDSIGRDVQIEEEIFSEDLGL